MAKPGRHAAPHRRGGAGHPVDRPARGDRAQRADAHRRGDAAGARRARLSASSRRRSHTAILAAAQFATGPGAAGRRAVRPRPADGLPGARRLRSRGRRPRLGRASRRGRALHRRPRAPDRRAARLATTPPTRSTRAWPRRRCSSRAASPTTCSPPTRRSGSSTARPRDHPRHAVGADARRLRPPAGVEQARRARPAGGRHPRMVRRAPARRVAGAARRRRDDADVPASTRRRAGRSARRRSPRLARGQVRHAVGRAPDRSSRAWRRPRDRRRDRPGRRRGRRLRDDASAPRSRARRPTCCPRSAARRYTLLGRPAIAARLRGRRRRRRTSRSPADSGTSRRTAARRSSRAASTGPRGSGDQAWQLYPNGWTFQPGHVPKLELLGSDPPFARPSNGDVRDHRRAPGADVCRPARAPARVHRRAAGSGWRCAAHAAASARVRRWPACACAASTST